MRPKAGRGKTANVGPTKHGSDYTNLLKHVKLGAGVCRSLAIPVFYPGKRRDVKSLTTGYKLLWHIGV
jgi:hypothetical protein